MRCLFVRNGSVALAGDLLDLDRLRLIGWANWNPIGLEGPPATPADEYDHYLMQAAIMIASGRSEAEVVEYFVRCVEVDMGMTPADYAAAQTTAAAIKAVSKPNGCNGSESEVTGRPMVDVAMIEPGGLFELAMIGLDEELPAPRAELTGWAAVNHLHRLGSREVLDLALAACIEPEPLRRRVGACILGQLGHAKIGFEPVFMEERYEGLTKLLAAEKAGPGDPAVLVDTCIALGHLHDPRAIPMLLQLGTHPEAGVRRAVASALGGHLENEAVDGLILLSGDADEEVRDWATFELGQLIECDTPTLRAALHARLDDHSADIRGEAIEGLAKRGDRSVLPTLIRELHIGVSQPLLDAAIALATPDLCEALAAAKQGGLLVQASHGPFDLSSEWDEATRACGC